MFKKIGLAPTLSDQVTEELRGRIESGQLKPGEKLPAEILLAPEFGVRRTVVREAISRLKHEGLLESRQGSGVFVSHKPAISPLKIDESVLESRNSVLQILELRRAIESEATALAAQRRSSSELREIESALDSLDALDAEASTAGDGVDADVAFHRSIALATGNPFFLKTIEFLLQYLKAAVRAGRANQDFIRAVREEHQAIIHAIRKQDAVGARTAAAIHMFNAARRIATVNPRCHRRGLS